MNTRKNMKIEISIRRTLSQDQQRLGRQVWDSWSLLCQEKTNQTESKT